MMKNTAAEWIVLILMVQASLLLSTGETMTNIDSSQPFLFQMCQLTGPSFDLTFMPEFADLIPSIEPVNLTLELRVGVTDPDGVATVIGSYKNNSITEWNNVTMTRDASTSDPNDFVAWPLNYTMNEPSFLVIWDIKFHANDSLNNWNTSSLHQMSICRQGSADTTTNNTTSSATSTNADIDFFVPLVMAAAFVVIILPVLYVMYRRRVLH